MWSDVAVISFVRSVVIVEFIYVIYRAGGRSVWEKNCALGLEYGPKAEGRTQDQGHIFLNSYISLAYFSLHGDVYNKLCKH